MNASPRVARPLTAILFVVAAAALGGATWTVVSRGRERATAPIARSFPFEPGDSTRLRAFIVVNANDCSSNLSFLVLFQRDTTQVRLSRLYFRGPRGELATTATRLRERGVNTPLVPETEGVSRALRALGSINTPFLVVLDVDGVVRLAMTSPPDIETYVKFPQLLKSLWEQGVYDPLKVP
jgi:hypothetical protein